MSDIELQALIAEVERENLLMMDDLARLGSLQFNPRTEAYLALSAELERRKEERAGGTSIAASRPEGSKGER